MNSAPIRSFGSSRFGLVLFSLAAAVSACAKDRGGSGPFDGSGGDADGFYTSSHGTGTSSVSTESGNPSTGSQMVTSTGETVGTAASAATGTGGEGGAASGCSHDPCVEGVALAAECDPCVAAVCRVDPICCGSDRGTWDDICTSEVPDLCGIDCGGGGAGGGASGSGGAGGSASTGTGGEGGVGPGDLVITEIMNNPGSVSDTSGEWFEIQNVSDASIDLDGLRIVHDDSGTTHVIGRSVVLAPGAYAVLGRNGDFGSNGGIDVDYVYTGISLNNDTDLLSIENGRIVVDFVTWDAGADLNPSDASRNLDPFFSAADANDDETHWCESQSFIHGSAGDRGTPGGPNDACE